MARKYIHCKGCWKHLSRFDTCASLSLYNKLLKNTPNDLGFINTDVYISEKVIIYCKLLDIKNKDE